MFAIAIRYLTGRATATHPSHREKPEWPPHPGRLFMALVAAWGDRTDAAERAALEALEQLGPPALHVPEASESAPVGYFVPVNDVRGVLALPSSRHKAARHFPSVVPEREAVHFIWPAAELREADRRAIAGLCGRVTYLGHSSTLVQAYPADAPPEPNLVPVEGRAPLRLRAIGEGRLAQLVADYGAGRRPGPSPWQGYAPPAPAPRARPESGALAGNFLVLRRASGRKLALPSTLALTEALRGLVMSSGQQPPPEVLSGHAADGTPARKPHLGFAPLADVGHAHAEGHLLGVAALIPKGASDAERAACIQAIARALDNPLVMGRLGSWQLESVPPGDVSRRALDPATWSRPSCRWATVTPIVLDRFPKREGDAEATIALACERAGLPRPAEVIVVPVSPILGVPLAREFPAASGGKEKPKRVHTHAVLLFTEPVAGPVLLGAGRFRGYGFCRPLAQEAP